MNSMIYDPLREFESKYKNLHEATALKFFDELTKKSGVDIEENRKTVKEYNEYKFRLSNLKKKLNLKRFLRVLMCISLVLIPLVIIKITPQIKALRADIVDADMRIKELFDKANNEMLPLNRLFTDRDAVDITEDVIPLLSFEKCFSTKQEEDMKTNYDFEVPENAEQSTIDVLAGHYNENPFLFEAKIIHTMGEETYHGYKTITWTETYRDSKGHLRTRMRTDTLHASVTKPKPFYITEVVLNYCAQGAPDLSFTRDATNLHKKNEKELARHVKRGERKLRKLNEEALRENDDFTSMSNTEFEVLFDALDRDNEVEFRELFTPLAQTNMVSLISSDKGFGDDFNFIKRKRTNRIYTNHSRGRTINLFPNEYYSYSYDIIKNNFISKNVAFFKNIYFDFAPLFAIPAYQERPVHSLKPIPDYSKKYSYKECETLANLLDRKYVVHPFTKTPAILKASFKGNDGMADQACITAYSYDIDKKIDYISVHGGDGHDHMVPVEWDDYLPLSASHDFFVAENTYAAGHDIIGRHGDICIYVK